MTRSSDTSRPDGPSGDSTADSTVDPTADPAPATDGPTAEQVARYLLDHPEFLTEHPDVLAQAIPPDRWSGDRVVDMQQFMLRRLRDEMESLRTCARDVIETSRTNMAVQTRIHAAVLALLNAGNLADLNRVILDDLPLLLDLDVVAILFEKTAPVPPQLAGPGVPALEAGTVERELGPGRSVALKGEEAQGDVYFGPAAGLVTSAALVRLQPSKAMPKGLLALGSRDPSMFQPGQGTELIDFLARIVERCIQGWIEKTG